jgi:spore maturation protein A
MLNASGGGITLCLTLAGIYIVWGGIVQIAIDAGIIEKLSRLMSPIIRFLFGKQTPEINALIATNISANMIGAGAAATPAAIQAIEKMQTPNQTKASTPMIMLFILSATSMQILPTTVLGLLEKHGAAQSGNIILPTILVSTITTIVGIILVKILGAGEEGGRGGERPAKS